MYTRGEGGGLGPCWFEGGEGVPTNPSNHLFLRRGQRMQIVPIHHGHAKNRRPWIPLHVVSGPWTSLVAALDEGRSNMAVCRRYRVFIPESQLFWLSRLFRLPRPNLLLGFALESLRHFFLSFYTAIFKPTDLFELVFQTAEF